MKHITLIISLVMVSDLAFAGRVRGYVKKNGTYVSPSYRTKADNSKWNNYSSKGNTNPFKGKKGKK